MPAATAEADALTFLAAAATTFFLLEPDDEDEVPFLTVAARDDAALLALDLAAGERGPEVEDEVDERGTTSAERRRP